MASDTFSVFKGARVLVTGHTGFTGPWLVLWLKELGAEVTGVSLPPEGEENLFRAAGIEEVCDSRFADINDYPAFKAIVDEVRPTFLFHLAAQSLVRPAYHDPLETFRTNVVGTANVLEAARNCDAVKSVVCVTTDKVYDNKEWVWAYRENDPLGGKDPYSASKGAAEIVAGSYQRALAPLTHGVAIGTARGGNIIGGGDWSVDRLVPDFVRAASSGTGLTLRFPEATRPWQHVIALCDGYLRLAAALIAEPEKHIRGWNFGPSDDAARTVREVVEGLSARWRRPDISYMETELSEARLLAVDSTQARTELGWRSPWSFDDVLDATAAWYKAYYDDPSRTREITLEQLRAYAAASE